MRRDVTQNGSISVDRRRSRECVAPQEAARGQSASIRREALCRSKTGRMHRPASMLTKVIVVAVVSFAAVAVAIPQPFDVAGSTMAGASAPAMMPNQHLHARATTPRVRVATRQAQRRPVAGEEPRPRRDRQVTIPGIREVFPDLFLAPRPDLGLLGPVEQRQNGRFLVSLVLPTFSLEACRPLCEPAFIENVARTYSLLSEFATLCLEVVVDYEPALEDLFADSVFAATTTSWCSLHTHTFVQAGVGRTLVFHLTERLAA